MQLVDQRMYAQKTSGRRSPDRQSRDVLLRALQERTPELAELRRVAGSQFDPAVVDAFSELVVELVWPPAPAPARVSGGGAR
jgi:hypothetical protein